MKANFLAETMNSLKTGFEKNKPTIYMVGGIIGLVTASVGACYATLKAKEVVEEHKKCIDTIHEAVELDTESYTVEEARKETVVTFGKTGLGFVKLYAPSVILGALSIGLICKSNHELQERNGQLAMAYTSLHEGYRLYRKRVVDRFGEDVDKELVTGAKKVIEKEKITDENGKTKTVKKEVTVVPEHDSLSSPYAFFFDAGSERWSKDPEMNKVFLLSKQEYWNTMLKTRKSKTVFLNEILRDLGIQETKAGQLVGWVFDPNNSEKDCYIDFGIFNAYSEANRNFVNGYESVVLLDFNVDGNIWKEL